MPPAPPAADDDDDDEMKLPAAVLGRVLGLRALHEKREEVMSEYVKERAASKRSIGRRSIPSSKTEQESSTGSWSPHYPTRTSRRWRRPGRRPTKM